MAFGCPVSENGPAPGLPICPVTRCRFRMAAFLSVPTWLWLIPMLQSVIAARAPPKRRAAATMISAERPVIAAARAGG